MCRPSRAVLPCLIRLSIKSNPLYISFSTMISFVVIAFEFNSRSSFRLMIPEKATWALLPLDFMWRNLDTISPPNSSAGAVWPGWQSGDRHPGLLIFKVKNKLRALL